MTQTKKDSIVTQPSGGVRVSLVRTVEIRLVFHSLIAHLSSKVVLSLQVVDEDPYMICCS